MENFGNIAYRDFNKKYKKQKCLSPEKAGFSEVWLTKKYYNNETVVLKFLKYDKYDFREIIVEGSEHVMQYSGYGRIQSREDPEFYQLFIEMPYSELGDLDSMFKSGLNENDFLYILEDIVKGLQELHNHNIIHRDINPNNILLFPLADNDRNFIAKITDFNICKNTTDSENTGTSPELIPRRAPYAPPELYADIYPGLTPAEINQNTYDFWGIGIIIMEFYYMKEFPKSNNSEKADFLKNLKRREISPEIDKLPLPFKSIAELCLVKDYTKRVKNANSLLHIIDEYRKSFILGRSISKADMHYSDHEYIKALEQYRIILRKNDSIFIKEKIEKILVIIQETRWVFKELLKDDKEKNILNKLDTIVNNETLKEKVKTLPADYLDPDLLPKKQSPNHNSLKDFNINIKSLIRRLKQNIMKRKFYLPVGIIVLATVIYFIVFKNRIINDKAIYYETCYKNCKYPECKIKFLDSLLAESQKNTYNKKKYSWVTRTLDSLTSYCIFKSNDLNKYISYFTASNKLFFFPEIIKKLKAKNQNFIWKDTVNNILYPVISDGSKLWFDSIYRGKQSDKKVSLTYLCPVCFSPLMNGEKYYFPHNGGRTDWYNNLSEFQSIHDFSLNPDDYLRYNPCPICVNSNPNYNTEKYALKSTNEKYLVAYDTFLKLPLKWRIPLVSEVREQIPGLENKKSFIVKLFDIPNVSQGLSTNLKIWNPKMGFELSNNNHYGYLYLVMDISSIINASIDIKTKNKIK